MRNVKQLVDLLRQLAVVGRPDTAASARCAAESLQRGVVAASAGPALGAEEADAAWHDAVAGADVPSRETAPEVAPRAA